MILRLFASKSPLLFFAAPVISVGGLFLILQGASPPRIEAVTLFNGLQGAIFAHPYFILATAALLIWVEAILVNQLFNRFEFYQGSSNVPMLIFAITATSLCTFHISLPFLASNLFLIAGLYRLFDVYRQPRVLAHYFECAFLFGISTLFYAPHIALFPGLLLCMMFTRSFNWREYTVCLLGFAFPFVFWLCWKFCMGDMRDFLIFGGIERPDFELFNRMSAGQRIFLVALAVTLLFSVSGFVFNKNYASTKSRNIRGVCLIISSFLVAGIATSKPLLAYWDFSPVLLPMTFISGVWFSNYRYSLTAPFVFYGYLVACLWPIFSPAN